MEVLVISHKYPPSIGGMQQHCFKLVEQLERNHTVHKLIFKSNYPKALFFLTTVIRALIMLRKHPKTEAIYLNDGLMALIATPLLFLTKKPMIVTIHGLDINFPSAAYRWWVRNYLNRFHGVITISSATTATCLEKGLKRSIIHQVENAVDIHVAHYKKRPDFKKEMSQELNVDLQDKFILVSLGRAIPRKGFNWFTRNVFPKLPDNCVYFVIARKFEQAKLFRWIERFTTKSLFEKIRLLVGAEVDDMAVNHSIQELGLEKSVFYLSRFTKDKNKIFDIIANSDLFVMPNIKIAGDFEGFGLVALEAAALGTLTLAANVDGIPSAVKDGETGYLLEQGNASEWVKKITYYINNPQEKNLTAEAFKKNTETRHSSWENMTYRYVEVFKKVADQQKSTSV